MTTPAEPASGHPVLTAFLALCAEDLAAGALRPVEEYQRRFPGYETLVAREHAALLAADSLTLPDLRRGTVAGAPPATIGPWRLVERLGEGGYGVVWLAEDTRLPRRVALKILRSTGFAADEALQRFRREAATAARLDHPSICTVIETGNDAGVPWIAMRLVEGTTLARLVAAARAADPARVPTRAALLPAPARPDDDAPATRAEGAGGGSSREVLLRIAHLVEEAARALHAAHEARVIHRDVKPGNIMVTPSGRPVLLDFGLAREIDDETLTQPWEMLGTVAYMSPEQIARDGELDRRTDVWSLGVTLYECLTLERPFQAPSVERLLEAIRTREPQDPRRVNPAIPRDLAIVALAALEKDRNRRYASALDLAEDLRRVRERRPVSARPAGLPLRLTRWAQRKPALAALLAVVLLVLPAAGAWIAAQLPGIAEGERVRRAAWIESRVEAGFLALTGLKPDAPGDARRIFDEVLAKEPRHLEAFAGAAVARRRTHDWPAALAFLDTWSEAATLLPALRGVRADILRKLGRDAEADRLLEGLPPSNEAFNDFLLGLRELSPDLGEDVTPHVRVLEHARRAVQRSRRARPNYHFLWAQAAGMAHDLASASECAAAITSLWPDRAIAWFWAGFTLGMSNDPGAAIPCLEKALALEPDLHEARTTLGSCYVLLGRKADARRLNEEILARDPRNHTAHYELAKFAMEDEEWSAAAGHLRRGIATDPEPWLPRHKDLVECLLAAGEPAEALAAARAASALAGEKDPAIAVALGRALLAAGLEDEAREAAARARSLLDATPDADPAVRSALRAVLAELREGR